MYFLTKRLPLFLCAHYHNIGGKYRLKKKTAIVTSLQMYTVKILQNFLFKME